jgi:hypothetical protein
MMAALQFVDDGFTDAIETSRDPALLFMISEWLKRWTPSGDGNLKILDIGHRKV